VSKIAAEESVVAARRNSVLLSNMQRRASNVARRASNVATNFIRKVQGNNKLIAGAETILIPEATEWALALAQETGKTLGPLSQRLSITRLSTIMKLKTDVNRAAQRRHQYPSNDNENTSDDDDEERSYASFMSDSSSSSSSSSSSNSSSSGSAIVSSSIRHPSPVSPPAGDHGVTGGTSGGDIDPVKRLTLLLDDVRPSILHLLCRLYKQLLSMSYIYYRFIYSLIHSFIHL
jgi:hypothetical protein